MQRLDPEGQRLHEGFWGPGLAARGKRAGRSEDLGVCDLAVLRGLLHHDLRK